MELEELRRAMWGPGQVILSNLTTFISKLLVVFLIVLLGWFAASLIKKLFVQFLKVLKVDLMSEKSGVANILLKGDIHQTLSEILGSIVYWTIMLVVVLTAVNVLNLTVAASLLNSVILYIPHVIAGLLILVIGIFFASILATMVRTTAANYDFKHAKGLGHLTQSVIIIFTVVQALSQLQLDVAIFNFLIQATVFALALGIGLAIGLGGKDIAAKYIQSLIDSFKNNS